MTVYAKIENNELITAYNGYNGVIGLADNPDLCLANGFSAFTEDEISGYFAGSYVIVNGKLQDVSSTDEYKIKQKALKISFLQSQLDDLDKKRIRAVCEPSNHPDGGTWLDYYTKQIQDLRAQIANLS